MLIRRSLHLAAAFGLALLAPTSALAQPRTPAAPAPKSWVMNQGDDVDPETKRPVRFCALQLKIDATNTIAIGAIGGGSSTNQAVPFLTIQMSPSAAPQTIDERVRLIIDGKRHDFAVADVIVNSPMTRLVVVDVPFNQSLLDALRQASEIRIIGHAWNGALTAVAANQSAFTAFSTCRNN